MASYGAMIRQWRSEKKWSQRALAAALGCSDGYVALMESDSKVPSLDLCMALIQVFQLRPQEQQAFLEAIESARRRATDTRVRMRSAVVRGMLEARGPLEPSPPEPPSSQMSVAAIAREIAADAELQAAYRDLQVALSVPEMRQTVRDTLRLFAERARSGA